MHLHPRWTDSIHHVAAPGRPLAGPQACVAGTTMRSRTEADAAACRADHMRRIRDRVQSGWYSSPAGVKALATCLLASGAL